MIGMHCSVVGPKGQTTWFQLARFASSIKAVLNGGAYLQVTNPRQRKKSIVGRLVAAKPMPKSVT
ncbi:MAG: hypothetical protein C4289_10690 [Chloroflexota bacterium]